MGSAHTRPSGMRALKKSYADKSTVNVEI